MKPIERDMEGQPLPPVDPGRVAKAAEAASKAGKKPRKDRGTRRVVLPGLLLGRIEKHAEDVDLPMEKFLGKLLTDYEEGQEEPITLPPAVLARLAPAAAGSGRSISELLADIEGYLCDLLDGRLLTASPRTGDQTRDQAPPASSPANVWGISSLEELLVEAFRARRRPPQEPTS